MSQTNPAPIPFIKAEANGNDFIIVEKEVAAAARASFAREICDRHTGIGADGVEFLTRDGDELSLVLFNADGSEAEISGNGTRCVVAACAQQYGFRSGRVHTRAGIKTAHVSDEREGVWQVELGMGAPQLDSSSVPMRLADGPRDRVQNFSLQLTSKSVTLTALSMGNPQVCLLVDQFPEDWRELGAQLESHALFPERTNVEFVKVTGPDAIEILIYERGVGPTESSGTGSCASAVTALLAGKVSSPVRVKSPGGMQEVAWSPGEQVRLRGPARIIAKGDYYPGKS